MDYRVLRYELINEFKTKIAKIIGILFIGFVVGWYVAYQLIVQLKTKMLPPGVNIVALTPLEFVMVQTKISLLFVLAILLPPMMFWLTKKINFKIKKRTILIWGITLGIFFVGGVLFAYTVLLPFIISFLTTTVIEAGIEPMYSLEGFMLFNISMMVILGLVFEFPVVTAWLSRAGMISSKMLTERRRYAYVGIFIVAAVITPDPSPVSQILVAIPFIFFYEISIISAKIFGKIQQNT